MCVGSRQIRFGMFGIYLLMFVFAARAEEYKIVLDRPLKVGQTYSISASGESTQKMTMDIPGAGPQKQNVSFTAQLEGTIKVLAIDDATGQATKVECMVRKLMKSDKSALDAGTVVTAKNDKGKETFMVNGMPAGHDAEEALGLLLSEHQPGAPSDNQIFGTDKPQSLGATWPIDTAAAATDAAGNGIPVTKDDIKGASKLVGVKKVDGKDSLEVHAEMGVDNLAGPLPDGSKIISGSMKAHFEGLFPIDESAQPVSQSQSMKLHMKMSVSGPGGQPVSVDTNMSRSMKATFGPAK